VDEVLVAAMTWQHGNMALNTGISFYRKYNFTYWPVPIYFLEHVLH
jgi:hypothetical protein